jgi:uroporphyrinogen-III decarboxylase
LLISPTSVREFLLPYYGQLLANARARQKRKVHFQVDTDGDCRPAIPIYREVGMTALSPFEVAAGCDVVEIARRYPDLVIMGGFDKRILAAGRDAIESELQRIIPFMLDRGGYYPTCDHGVPDDVSFENYLYYRRRVCALDHR